MDFQVVVLLGFGEHCYQLVWTKNGSFECLSNRWSTLFLKLEFKNVFSSKTKITPYVMHFCILYFCILYFCIFVFLYFCIFVFLYCCIFVFLYFCILYFCIFVFCVSALTLAACNVFTSKTIRSAYTDAYLFCIAIRCCCCCCCCC